MLSRNLRSAVLCRWKVDKTEMVAVVGWPCGCALYWVWAPEKLCRILDGLEWRAWNLKGSWVDTYIYIFMVAPPPPLPELSTSILCIPRNRSLQDYSVRAYVYTLNPSMCVCV